MTTTASELKLTPSAKAVSVTTSASDSVDEASDAYLFCGQEPLPTPRAAPRPRTNKPPPTPKPRSGKCA